MSESRYSARRIQAAQRREKALQMRLSGASCADIGRELGVTQQRAWDIVNDEMQRAAKRRSESADAVVQSTLQRFDAAIKALWPKIEAGDPVAIAEMRKIETTRLRIYGKLDRPNQTIVFQQNHFERVAALVKEHAGGQVGAIVDAIPALTALPSAIPTAPVIAVMPIERGGEAVTSDQPWPLSSSGTNGSHQHE